MLRKFLKALKNSFDLDKYYTELLDYYKSVRHD